MTPPSSSRRRSWRRCAPRFEAPEVDHDRANRDRDHRWRPGRSGRGLPPDQARSAVRDLGRVPADRRLLAEALGLAPRVHPGSPRRAAGHAVPGTGLVVPDQGRGCRLPGRVRCPLRSPRAIGRPGGRTLQVRGPVRRDVRPEPVRGRQRRGGDRRLPSPPSPGVRGRTRSGDRPAALERVPQPVPARRRRRPRRGRRELGGRDRVGGVPRSPDLAVGKGHRARTGPPGKRTGSVGHAG